MSKVKPLLPGPVAAARRVLAECDVQHPRDIHVEAIAARYGAVVLYGPTATAHGSIMRSSQRAVIWVDEAARGQPRADFTAAHELGHHLIHNLVDHFAQCHGEEESPGVRATSRTIEKEANHFSVELRMPEVWAAPLCDVPRPTLDDVYCLARTFRASFHSSALRFVELSAAPCAFVHTVKGKIKRSTETAAFPGRIVQTRAVHPQTVAARLQGQRPGGEVPAREVSGAAWGDEGGNGFLEHAIALGPEVGVMSFVVAV